MNGINTHLTIVVCDGAQDAIDKGYNYNAWETTPKPLTIEKAVIVRGGMQSGASTVDLVLVDDAGNRYVTMVTGNLIGSLPL